MILAYQINGGGGKTAPDMFELMTEVIKHISWTIPPALPGDYKRLLHSQLPAEFPSIACVRACVCR